MLYTRLDKFVVEMRTSSDEKKKSKYCWCV